VSERKGVPVLLPPKDKAEALKEVMESLNSRTYTLLLIAPKKDGSGEWIVIVEKGQVFILERLYL